MRGFRRALLLLSLMTCPSCGEAPSAPGLELRPGASLFDRLERLQVAQLADSNVPAPLRARVAQAFAERTQVIPPEAWVQAGEALNRPGEFQWRVHTQLRMDLKLGRPWLTHAGRTCASFNQVPRREARPTAITGWKDPTGDLVFGWSAGPGELVAAAKERPQEVRIGWEMDAEQDGVALEPVLQHGSPPADARALLRTLVFDHVTRPVLVAGAPARLVARVDLAAVDELRLAVALWDVGFALKGEQLARVPSTSDGVRFEVLVDGTSAWSLAVTDKNVFHEVSIDLTRFRGRDAEVVLQTEPGPGGDASFDYGVWSGLSFHGDERVAPTRPHIVLVDVDTLRADRLGCYGHGRDTSPRLDRWAAREATVYEDAVSAACWTLPATISILTGLAPVQHGVISGLMTMSAGLEPIAARLRAAGYETRGRSDGAYVSASFGFGHGFDSYDDRVRPREEHEQTGWQAELARIRARRSERPLFYFLQTYQVHGPYPLDRRFEDAARPYRGRFLTETPSRDEVAFHDDGLDEADWRWLNDTYDAGVRRMDDVVGPFLDGLAAAFGDDPYLVIVTSDHGEELGEHGGLGHGHALYQELLRVPLLIRAPDQPVGRREARPVTTLDLVPTMLDWAGLEIPAHLSGRSLRQPLPEQRLRVAEHDGTAFATYLDGWKLLTGSIKRYPRSGPFPRLLRYREDPREERDLLPESADRARELEKLLADFLAGHPALHVERTGGPLADEALLKELQDLGYAGDE